MRFLVSHIGNDYTNLEIIEKSFNYKKYVEIFQFSKYKKCDKEFTINENIYEFKDRNHALMYAINTDFNECILCIKKSEENDAENHYFYLLKTNGKIFFINFGQEILTESQKSRGRINKIQDEILDNIFLDYRRLFNKSDSKEIIKIDENINCKIVGKLKDLSKDEVLFNYVVMNKLKEKYHDLKEELKEISTTPYLFYNNIQIESGKPIKLIGYEGEINIKKRYDDEELNVVQKYNRTKRLKKLLDDKFEELKDDEILKSDIRFHNEEYNEDLIIPSDWIGSLDRIKQKSEYYYRQIENINYAILMNKLKYNNQIDYYEPLKKSFRNIINNNIKSFNDIVKVYKNSKKFKVKKDDSKWRTVYFHKLFQTFIIYKTLLKNIKKTENLF